MAATAKTKADVQNQSSRDRAWDELETKYSQERAESDKAYDQNKAAFERGLIGKGMQRSSYGGQVAAGYDKEKINAQNKSFENQIAAYQKEVDAIEQREAEERYRNAQLGLQYAQLEQQNKQFEAEMKYKQDQADIAQKNTEWQQKFQQSQSDLSQQNTDRAYWYGVEQDKLEQSRWENEFGLKQDSLDQDKANTEWSHNFQEGQAALEQSRWENEFAYGQASAQQQQAYNSLQQIAALGNDAPDELLAEAHVSRDTFNAMKAQKTSSGRSGNNPKPTNEPTNIPTDEDVEQDWDLFKKFRDVPTNSTLSDKTANTNYRSDVSDFFKKHLNKK